MEGRARSRLRDMRVVRRKEINGVFKLAMPLTLQQQVVSLETAKRMEKLGFPQESQFYWVDAGTVENPKWVIMYRGWTDAGLPYPRNCAAYTLSEAIALCGNNFGRLEYETFEQYKTGVPGWFAYERNEMRNINVQRPTAEEAVCALALHLKENNLI